MTDLVRGVTALAVDSRRSGTVYAALTQTGIYKPTNGRTWIHAIGTPLFSPLRRRSRPARPATIYAAGASEADGRPLILRSTDSGRTWETAG